MQCVEYFVFMQAKHHCYEVFPVAQYVALLVCLMKLSIALIPFLWYYLHDLLCEQDLQVKAFLIVGLKRDVYTLGIFLFFIF